MQAQQLNQSVKEAEVLAKGYRLNPVDGVLEGSVYITKANIWVPVMPATTVLAEYFNGSCGERGGMTWR
eukprot:1922306-Karenia_brevis.AAC.1